MEQAGANTGRRREGVTDLVTHFEPTEYYIAGDICVVYKLIFFKRMSESRKPNFTKAELCQAGNVSF